MRALLDGYAEHAAVPHPLDPGIFSASLCAAMNWLVSRIRIALDPHEDAGERELAARTVPTLLVDPPSRQRCEAVLDALG